MCEFELVDGIKVTWDGTLLNCDGQRNSVTITLNHEGIPSSDPVHLIAEGEELTNDNLYAPGDSRTVEYPAGAPIRFEAWTVDGLFRDSATLDNPSNEDVVVWLPPDLFVIDN